MGNTLELAVSTAQNIIVFEFEDSHNCKSESGASYGFATAANTCLGASKCHIQSKSIATWPEWLMWVLLAWIEY